MNPQQMQPKHWFLLALLFRFLASFTQLGTSHPDEWYQTVEFGNFLAFGFLSQSGEFILHMRNLTWPTLLVLPMQFARWISSGDLAAQMFAIKFTTGLCDLGILWGISQLLGQKKKELKKSQIQIGWVLFVLPWFWVVESMRPSQEHLSAIACLVSLGCFARGNKSSLFSFVGGIFLVLTAAFRYPSGLFGAGIFLGLLFNWILKRPSARPLPTLLGIGFGLFLGGAADWFYYGRPWESFWMYFQFNVLTGLSSHLFGSQSFFSTYYPFFKGYFGGILAPVGILAFVLVPLGWLSALKRSELWAFALLFFILGHAWIPHKEARFMIAILPLVVWAFLNGIWQMESLFHRSHFLQQNLSVLKTFRKIFKTALVIIFILNGALLLRALWGETWRTNQNYLDLSRLLQNRDVCAAITIKRPLAALLPWKNLHQVPQPAIGFFPAPAHQNSSPSLQDKPVIWVAHPPDCKSEQKILFQPQKPELFWSEQGKCELLPSGLLKWAPRSTWKYLLEKNLVSAPWHECPSDFLRFFKRQEVRVTLRKEMRKLDTLPPPGLTGDEFLKQAWGNLDPQDPLNRDATFGDW